MIKKIEGIVVKELTYKETSKIIDVYTKDGIYSVIAKGAKRIKSPFFSGTNFLSYGEFCIYEKDNLSTLKSVDLKDNFKNILKDILRLSAATYVINLAIQIYKQNNNSDIYKLLIASLNKLNSNINPLGIVNIFEIKMLAYLGLHLNLDECRICGSKNIVYLSLDYSGYLCNNCTDSRMNPKMLKLIKIYNKVDINKIDKLEVDSKLLISINKFIDEYYEKYTGLYLKSKNFFIKLL